jgi:hypothetical protein
MVRSMRFLIGVLATASVMMTGCYNNPHTSEKLPGEGPENIMSKPAVGPGTTAGGSTAGPQPVRERVEGGHVTPTPGGAVPAEPGLGHAGAPEPQMRPGADTPPGPATRMGNEKGRDLRGPAEHPETKH